MFFDFLTQLINRFVKLPFSYVSWQTHETVITNTIYLSSYVLVTFFVLSIWL